MIWNHLTRHRNESYSLSSDSVTPLKNGRFVLMSARQEVARPEGLANLGRAMYFITSPTA